MTVCTWSTSSYFYTFFLRCPYFFSGKTGTHFRSGAAAADTKLLQQCFTNFQLVVEKYAVYKEGGFGFFCFLRPDCYKRNGYHLAIVVIDVSAVVVVHGAGGRGGRVHPAHYISRPLVNHATKQSLLPPRSLSALSLSFSLRKNGGKFCANI
jgi:hypothetical protein